MLPCNWLYIPVFCEDTSQDNVPEVQIILIEKAFDVGLH